MLQEEEDQILRIQNIRFFKNCSELYHNDPHPHHATTESIAFETKKRCREWQNNSTQIWWQIALPSPNLGKNHPKNITIPSANHSTQGNSHLSNSNNILYIKGADLLKQLWQTAASISKNSHAFRHVQVMLFFSTFSSKYKNFAKA